MQTTSQLPSAPPHGVLSRLRHLLAPPQRDLLRGSLPLTQIVGDQAGSNRQETIDDRTRDNRRDPAIAP